MARAVAASRAVHGKLHTESQAVAVQRGFGRAANEGECRERGTQALCPVAEDVHSAPRISLERVLAIDPDIIVLLVGKPGERTRGLLDQWRQVSALRAVREGRIGIIRGRTTFSNGPGILTLADQLTSEVARLQGLDSVR